MLEITKLNITYKADQQGVVESISAIDPNKWRIASRVSATLIGGKQEQIRLIRPDSNGLFVVAMHPHYINKVRLSPYITFDDSRINEEQLRQHREGKFNELYRDESGFAPDYSLLVQLNNDPRDKSVAELASWGGRRDLQYVPLSQETSLVAEGGLPFYDLATDAYQQLETGFNLYALPYDSANLAWMSRSLISQKSVMLLFQAMGLESGVVVATEKQF